MHEASSVSVSGYMCVGLCGGQTAYGMTWYVYGRRRGRRKCVVLSERLSLEAVNTLRIRSTTDDTSNTRGSCPFVALRRHSTGA